MSKRRKSQRHHDAKAAAGRGCQDRQARYEKACELALAGQYDRAARLYASLGQTAERRLQALVRNDLAVLAAVGGATDSAQAGFAEALAVDETCAVARSNLAFLTAPSARAVAPVEREVSPTAPVTTGAVRVAVLSFLFNWPSTGGGTVHTFELARFLNKAGFEVKHLYARYGRWKVGEVRDPLPYPAEALDFDVNSWNVRAIQAAFRRAVDAFAPDHVIITDSWNMKPLLAEAVRGYPYILRFQAMECFCPLNNVRLLADETGVRQCPLHQFATPQECGRCVSARGNLSGSLHQVERALSAVGGPIYHEQLLRAVGEARAVLVVNPLHEAMISPYAAEVRVVTAGIDRARFPWPGPAPAATPTIVFAGLVDEWMKGFAVLRDACRRLWARRRDFALVATGDPPGQVDEFTHFVGWQSQEELPRLLSSAALVAVPTIAQEALGRTAVEAMAAGRPVVASRLGGLPFTVLDGCTGLLCEPGNADDLAHKIELLLDDPTLRARLGENGRRRFEEHYAWEQIIDRHYRPLLARPKCSGFQPRLRPSVDSAGLVAKTSAFFQMEQAEVDDMLARYRAVHEAKRYAEILGEHKTLSFEEAFVIYVLLARRRPKTIVEIGTQFGRSTRRLLDMKTLLGLDSPVVCFDLVEQARHFGPDEARVIVGDLTGTFRSSVLEAYEPGFIFVDVHARATLREIVTETLKTSGWTLALHDCGSGLCNPDMSQVRADAEITSSTGVWERHVLGDVFGIDDPLSDRLDAVTTPTHRLAIFATTHGLAVLLPQATTAGPAETTTGAEVTT